MYKLIGENNILNPREQILRNRGITEGLLNVGEEAIEDYMNYDNIIEGCELLMKHIESDNRICFIEDSDCDGLVSTSILVNYIKKHFPCTDIVIKTHKGKQHGLSDKDIKIEDGISLVVIPDAGTNDLKEMEELYNRGIDVLVIDHHELEGKYPEHCILINNQTSNRVKNKQLSGAGVVYKFLCAFSDYYYLDTPEEYLDALAIANIADVMDMRSEETRYFVKRGLENIRNPFIKALIEEKKFDLDGKLNINSVGWTISPLVNGCIRSGSIIEKDSLYQAMMCYDEEECLKIAKTCKNVKSRQDSAVKRSMTKIENELKINEEDRIIIADSLGANKSFTGLIAGKLSSKYKLPCILYSVKDGLAQGSIRGLGEIDFKQDLINSEMIEYCIGHSLAAGIGFKIENKDKLLKYINDIYKNVDFGTTEYEVDFELAEWELTQEFVDEVARFEDEVGNGIEFPMIVIKDCYTYLTGDNIKGRLNVVWDIGGIKVIKKFTSNVWKENNIGREFYCDIIGKCVIDSYSGKGCIEIVDIIEN